MTEPFNELCTAPWGKVLVNRHDFFLGACFRQHGEFSENELDLLRSITKPGQLVVDVGANLGALTVPLAQHVGPQGHVVAIEPQRLMFQLLCANVALNSLDNVTTLQIAAGHSRGTIAVPAFDPHHRKSAPGSISLVPGQSAGFEGTAAGKEPVEVFPLDSIDLRGVGLLKIDVEGMESHVLAGAHQTIARDRPLIYVENDRPEYSARLITALTDLGYRMWWHLPAMARQKIEGADPDYSVVVSVNMLALPDEVEAEIDPEMAVTGPDDDYHAAQHRYAKSRGLVIDIQSGALSPPSVAA